MLGTENYVFKPRKLTAWAWNGKAKSPQFDFFGVCFSPFGKRRRAVARSAKELLGAQLVVSPLQPHTAAPCTSQDCPVGTNSRAGAEHRVSELVCATSQGLKCSSRSKDKLCQGKAGTGQHTAKRIFYIS